MRDIASWLMANGELVFHLTMTIATVIIITSGFIAHRKRTVFISSRPSKPMKAVDYFVMAAERGDELSDEDYFKYRESFISDQEPNDDELSRVGYVVETYFPKLIIGFAAALLLMGLVAAPYFFIRYIA